MDDNRDLRERLIHAELELQYLRAKVDTMDLKLNAMMDIMQQAKGARWVLLIAASVGGFVATYGVKFMGFLGGLPR